MKSKSYKPQKKEIDEIKIPDAVPSEYLLRQIETGKLIPVGESKEELSPKQERIKALLAKGISFEEAALQVGYKDPETARNAIARTARKTAMRDMLVNWQLCDDRVLKEIVWGINESKSKEELRAHIEYIKLLKEINNEAFEPDKNEDGKRELNIKSFINYVQLKLDEKEAATLLGAIREFERINKGDI